MGTRERMAIAAHFHVLMRRHLGRVTDVEWMVTHRDYADAMVKVAQASPHGELSEWAARLVHSFDHDTGPPTEPPRSVPPGSHGAPAAGPTPPPRYVRGLR
jgi:hypothetical protein